MCEPDARDRRRARDRLLPADDGRLNVSERRMTDIRLQREASMPPPKRRR